MERERLGAKMPKKPLNPKLYYEVSRKANFQRLFPYHSHKQLQKLIYKAFEDLSPAWKQYYAQWYQNQSAAYERNTCLFIVNNLDAVIKHKVVCKKTVRKYLKIYDELGLANDA